MEDRQLQILTALVSIPGFNRKLIRRLLLLWEKKGISAAEAWSRKRRWKAESESLSDEQQESWSDFRKQWTPAEYWESLLSQGIEILGQEQFPELLREIDDPPLLLFAKGNRECLRPAHVAVVGSRTPTRYGQWATQKIVAQLIQHDVSIVSGFMVGIDYQSHQVAVSVGGRSIGVLGFGFGEMYPSHLRRAAAEFLEAGNLFVTEYPPGLPPSKWQFPERNRVVAGLSAATLVVEARENSGSLITAQCAVDAGRVVGAVPGAIDNVYSQGTHLLLRQGALLVTSGEDILEELGLITPKKGQKNLKSP